MIAEIIYLRESVMESCQRPIVKRMLLRPLKDIENLCRMQKRYDCTTFIDRGLDYIIISMLKMACRVCGIKTVQRKET